MFYIQNIFMENNQIIENILSREVHFHFSKSGGHGGQNVNKRETKAELYFNVQYSHYLTPEQKERLIQLAGHRIHHQESILIMTCQEERLQRANKEKVIHHFRQLVEEALSQPQHRIPTNIPNSEREARIVQKKHTSKNKQNRQKPPLEE